MSLTGAVTTGVGHHRGGSPQGRVTTGAGHHRGGSPQGRVTTGVGHHRGGSSQGWVTTGAGHHRDISTKNRTQLLVGELPIPESSCDGHVTSCPHRGNILAPATISKTLVFPALWSPTTTTFGSWSTNLPSLD